jgi:hypothetical protein
LSQKIIAPPARPERAPPPSFQTFAAFGGDLKLFLESRDHNPHLELAEHEGTLYSIVSGVYLCPSAQAILRAKEFNKLVCIMLDTTWTVMQQYVTSILIAVSRNTALTLVFAFGPTETVDL